MKKQALIALILSLILLCACVPTPDEEAVVNRADGALEKAVRGKPVDPYTYEAPTRLDNTELIREQEVRFEADVELPDAQQYPVTTIKQRTFAANDIAALLKAVSQGDWTIRENELSREELAVDLKNAAKGAYMGDDEETGEPIWEPMEDEMRRIQKLIEEAPVEDTFVPIEPKKLTFPIKMRAVRDGDGTVWYLFGKSGMISLSRFRDGNIQYEDWVLLGDATPGEPAHTLENIRISEADAIAKGDEVIAALGLTDFKVADVQKARYIQSYSYTNLGEGYFLTYVPALGGAVPCYYRESPDPEFLTWEYTKDSALTYAPLWDQEYVQMFITDEGLLHLGWDSPKETVLVANENVQLLPFEEIQKNVMKIIEYCTAGSKNAPILVKRIVLTTAIAQIPDQGDEAFLVPAWAFFVTNEQNERDHIPQEVLLVNALDGTMIYQSKLLDDLPDLP